MVFFVMRVLRVGVMRAAQSNDRFAREDQVNPRRSFYGNLRCGPSIAHAPGVGRINPYWIIRIASDSNLYVMSDFARRA